MKRGKSKKSSTGKKSLNKMFRDTFKVTAKDYRKGAKHKLTI